MWESYQGLFSPGQRQGCEQEQLKAQGWEAAWGWTWGLEDRAEEGSLPLKPTVCKLQNFFVFSSKYQKIYGSLSMCFWWEPPQADARELLTVCY